jgi:hypothetical protein
MKVKSIDWRVSMRIYLNICGTFMIDSDTPENRATAAEILQVLQVIPILIFQDTHYAMLVDSQRFLTCSHRL